MTQEKTDNELIAEFMGGITFDKNGICTDTKQKYSWRPGCYDILRVGHLQYHNSWDWLMPVVEKIAILQDLKHISMNGTIKLNLYSDGISVCKIGSIKENQGKLIKAVYISVVEFIKWYNKTKNP